MSPMMMRSMSSDPSRIPKPAGSLSVSGSDGVNSTSGIAVRRSFGWPQFGHVSACSEISLPQYAQNGIDVS